MLFEVFNRTWKIWVFVPIVLFLVSVLVLVNNVMTTGSFIERDVELTGGNLITVELTQSVDLFELQAALPYAKISVTQGVTTEILVETSSDYDPEGVMDDLRAFGVKGESSVKTVGPVLGEIFWSQTQLAIIAAFVLMAIVVFVLFRSIAPSGIVIFSAAADIISTMAIISLLDIKLSLYVLAALLMIIGYSIDTDILLTSELLKARGKEISERIKTAMKTGLTMSFTTIAALIALYTLSGTFVLKQIAFVLLIGIIIDIFVTWMGNTNILRIWLLRKEKHS